MTALEIAKELVRRPSVNPTHDAESPGESAVVDWLEGWGRTHTLQTLREPALPERDNISFTIKNGNGPHLLLNGQTNPNSHICAIQIEYDCFGDLNHCTN